jgi:Amt family ammonium transporter
LQFGKQVLSVIVVAAFAFSVTWILGKVVDATVGLRVREDEEVVGLDISQHGERVFGGISS